MRDRFVRLSAVVEHSAVGRFRFLGFTGGVAERLPATSLGLLDSYLQVPTVDHLAIHGNVITRACERSGAGEKAAPRSSLIL